MRYAVILYMLKNKQSIHSFFELLGNKKLAYDLLIIYCKENNHELLKYIYERLEQPNELGHLSVMLGFENEEKMMNNLTMASNIYSKNKKNSFFSKQTDDQIKLFRIQSDLDSQTEGLHKFKYMSLGDTIFKLIEITFYAQASKMAKEFKVPDSRYWWIQIRALSKSGKWQMMAELAKKRSPIGYAPDRKSVV